VMKSFITTIILSVALFLLPIAYAMEEKEVEKSFHRFNQQWMKSLHEMEKRGRANLRCKKVKDQYITVYTGYSTTYSSTIKKTDYKESPYIGILNYREKKFISRARTFEEAIQGPFNLIDDYPVTEIFVFKNGRWRY